MLIWCTVKHVSVPFSFGAQDDCLKGDCDWRFPPWHSDISRLSSATFSSLSIFLPSFCMRFQLEPLFFDGTEEDIITESPLQLDMERIVTFDPMSHCL